ncbi:MAG: agmatine deiminase family protein [Nitrososphaerota archaeon]|jgi:agmatine deiminase|nr:agmatine deiminase family protein [Nitrososphaerota archaeon]
MSVSSENNKIVTIGLIQTATSENIAKNIEKTIQKIEEATQKGAQIICLQELYRTRYFPQEENIDVAPLSEPIPGPSTEIFSNIAKKHGVVIIAPLFEKANEKFYNTATVIDADGALLGTYRKTHIPYDPYFYEKNYFAKGDEPHKVFNTAFAKIGVLICYDQWFPESARINTLAGAEIIFYPTAIGYIKNHTSDDGDWHDAWRIVQRAHAIVNGVHIAAVNRVGEEGELEFWGGSFVCDPFGAVLIEASTNKEEVIVTQIDLGRNKKIQEGWGFLRNRRPEIYHQLIENGALNPEEHRNKSCSAQGFVMPAEWEHHDATWLAWPYDPTTFPDRVKSVEQTYIEIIKELQESEAVNLFVIDEPTKKKVVEMFRCAGIDLDLVHIYVSDYADVWFRDYGPIFIRNSMHELAMVHWDFNSWGEKYETLLRDKQIPVVINKKLSLPYFKPGIVLEGGSIDVNGRGTLLTSEQCLLNSNRNPTLNKQKIEAYLIEYLGANHFIWLKKGILGDDTDGHIDDLARFVNSNTIVCAYTDDPNDEDYEALQENYQILTNAVDQDGKKLQIVKLPIPQVISDKDYRLPASYTNFYICNTKVLVPIFNHPNDEKAISILQEIFPTRKVVGIFCGDLVYGFGTIHCISQQQPSPT